MCHHVPWCFRAGHPLGQAVGEELGDGLRRSRVRHVLDVVVVVTARHLQRLAWVELLAGDKADVVGGTPDPMARGAVIFGSGAVLLCGCYGVVAVCRVAGVRLILEGLDAPWSRAPGATATTAARRTGASCILRDVCAASTHIFRKAIAAVAAEALDIRHGTDRGDLTLHLWCLLGDTTLAPLSIAGCAVLCRLPAVAVAFGSASLKGCATLVVRICSSHDALRLTP
mmetsp:Transcript_46370/g.64407  ORF Transcript_46370/g.64407 Transcript_46370/m.64407 type:complete len:227 (+) Transcript_46370:59-739(+)